MSRFWTEDEDRQLEELRMDGKTIREIADTLGRSWRSIQSRTCKFQIPRGIKHWKEMVSVLCVPHTTAEASKALGISRSGVRLAKRRLRKAGFTVFNAMRVVKAPGDR